MIEDEAKTKWCPFGRVGSAYGSTLNRSPFGTAASDSLCIGSACMAWRWGPDVDGIPAYRNTPIKDSPGHSIYEPLGFCGLAGKP